MPSDSELTPGLVIPTLRYRDAPSAIDWLCQAFGFEKHMVIPGEDGSIIHAQLTLGNGMIMLGSVRDEEQRDYDRLITQPDDVGGGNTQAAYIEIEDIDAHYERAKAAGAKIVIDIADQDHGGRLYTCRDPEGHVWNFGSYNPWQS
ncbi:VOC family protein [Pelagibius sp. Alg239-R121]|uniref:VOC family protein n=1 Tax=Pelagibius sp. Alg239-R121 TaxID=2993448 RepID=UPI0024A6E65E|nr:VOC family protein [Pelagibius sp. Alg239-R121]